MASTIPVKYGDKVHIRNGYNNWRGGYLDSYDAHYTNGKYYVYTSKIDDRIGQHTGTWMIESLTGKAIGSNVISSDIISLKNMYKNDGGYLSVMQPDPGPEWFGVATIDKGPVKLPNTARWHIFAEHPDLSVDTGSVHYGDVIRILSGYNDSTAGFLDVCGLAGVQGEVYGVFTALSSNRELNSAVWMIYPALDNLSDLNLNEALQDSLNYDSNLIL